MTLHGASFNSYRWYANTRSSCGKNRSTPALTTINAQSYQGTGIGQGSSFPNTAGQRSRPSSVWTGGNDRFKIWRTCCLSCSFTPLPPMALYSSADPKAVQLFSQYTKCAEYSYLHGPY